MNLYKEQFRSSSLRLPRWDYSQTGYYFVTICAMDREEYFAKIENGEAILSEIGKIIAEEWEKTEQVRKNVDLDAWVVMPNHFYGIIVIWNNNVPRVETPRRGVSTWKPNSLGSIVNQFKSVCTKRIWKSGFPGFHWQPNYYEHIIRNGRSLERIREYIRNNPLKWELDIENQKCVNSDKKYYERIFEE